MPHTLIVEDDRDSAEMLAELIKGEGFSTATAHTLAEARQQLALREPDLVLLDLALPDGSGMDLFADRPEAFAGSEVVMITGHASLDTSIQALRLGATDYLVKPINFRHLKNILSRVTPTGEMQKRIANFEKNVSDVGRFGPLWGRSKIMQEIYHQVARVARTSVSVLVTGQSGTGKEVVAQAIHELSRRRDRAFLAVNCGAISPQLIESEMFGHEKGSFTGAARQHQGYFERAKGGTLLLDEITEMPLDLQVKLLRVLETRMFQRIGGTESIETDVRIVAATNRDPLEAVATGKLREDLLYRLNVFRIDVPPLNERREDVELLANNFLAELNVQENAAKHFTPAAIQALTAHGWPGNVRQLRNAVQRAFIMAEDNDIDAGHLSFDAMSMPQASANDGASVTVRVGTSIAEMERKLIFATLDYCGGRREQAAELLGVSPKTLYNRLREYERDRER
ncbi:MAG: sigma-54-dependent Fis family transcriptional regulator [Burkholderiales bacterium]|nr:sigma-54-dependent Fis family transcriptional regulator [Burkholderiales bacterium]